MILWLPKSLLLSTFLVGTVVTSVAGSGVETVVIEKVQVAKSISGVVTDPSGAPIKGATVAEVADDEKTILRRVLTDNNGRFNLPQEPKRKTYHLLISSNGFNPLVVRVRTSRWTRRMLALRLELST